MKLVILDFEQVLQNSEYDSEFFALLLKSNTVALFSRSSVSVLDAYVNVLNLSREAKANLFLFPHRASTFFSYHGDKLHMIYENKLDDQSIIEAKKKLDKVFFDFKFSASNKNVTCNGNEISLSFGKKQTFASGNLLTMLEVISNEFQEFEVKTSGYMLCISKRCKNECFCFSKITKELAPSGERCYYICKKNDHKLEKNVNVITLEDFKLILEKEDI